MRFLEPPEPPFLAIVGRDGVQIFLKAVSEALVAQPNHTRHEWAPAWAVRIDLRTPGTIEFLWNGFEVDDNTAFNWYLDSFNRYSLPLGNTSTG